MGFGDAYLAVSPGMGLGIGFRGLRFRVTFASFETVRTLDVTYMGYSQNVEPFLVMDYITAPNIPKYQNVNLVSGASHMLF